ncbi:filamentous haemagglutinin family protein [Alcaligenes faecalis]|uniref:filamentous haemagglutinin family protein n=1 Tax=Alcaligenes faecalis TaxID=511 RepID=UPI001EF084E6|nr:filamentous haemagglutinin family protein [Alcaligenes faecalis]ULH06446.1 filamentous hemagglutinin family protein [Alcaligenes faecalis]
MSKAPVRAQSTAIRLRHRKTHGVVRKAHVLTPIAAAVLAVASGWALPQAQAQTAVRGAWFAAKGAVQNHVQGQSGPMPGANNGLLNSAARQHAESRQQLARSVENLGRTASAIAAQQAAQKAAREAAAKEAGAPDGHVQGGLWDRDAAGNLHVWTGADRPEHTVKDGKHTVAIKQTDSRAVLNWETFNVGRNTTVDFQQKATDAVLNRVVGADTAPSQIQGVIKGAGTVMVVNQNGVVFSGSSQVNVRNLVTAATEVDVDHFRNNGLYDKDSSRLFKNAAGKVLVEQGAQITTHTPPTASTQDGGYVLLLGSEVHNAGHITTPKGQTVLAAGDNFYIRKGVGTDGNANSTTAGNEVSTSRIADSTAGKVTNTGLIAAATGDITLTGRDVAQAGVVIATTSQAKRGTIHLSTRASDTEGLVTLGKDSTTAILLEDTDTTALDNQRDAALKNLDGTTPTNNAAGLYDNLSTVTDRRDLSRVEIVSGNTVEFQGDSTTLATGGEVVVSAKHRTLVDEAARLDVSGAMGVKVAMEANNLSINIQGNEQRDAPVNRDSKNLNNLDIWLDRRRLIHVSAGTNGYEGDRWYTAGGLLEVSGWLATSGHSVGEWMAQGGTITVTGNDLVTRAGSQINLSGGTLDVQSGFMRQSWLRGADGRLYSVDNAPGDLLFDGLYKGYEQHSERWGQTRSFYNPILAPTRRYEEGYTVGRDAGTLVVATGNAVLEGAIVSDVYQGDYQTEAAQAGLDGYYQSQYAVARAGQLVIGSYSGIYNADSGTLGYVLNPVLDSVTLAEVEASIADGLQLNDAVAEDRQGMLVLDTGLLNESSLGAVRIAAKESIAVDDALAVASGGEIVLYAPAVDVAADLTAHSGTIRLGNLLAQPYVTVTSDGTTYGVLDTSIAVPDTVDGGVTVHEGVTLDATGLFTDLRTADAGSGSALAYVDGGTVSIRSTESVTVEKSSMIDVSSGAAVLTDGSVSGGTGGNVQLGSGLISTGAGNTAAVLTLNGDIRGYGVNGGGTLEIESASAISIGGELLETEGVLKVGETTLADLVLLEDYEVKAGEVLPVDYSYAYDITLPGETIEAGVRFGSVTLAADWIPPYAVLFSTGTNPVSIGNDDFYIDGEQYRANSITVYDGYIRVYNITKGDFVEVSYIPAGTTVNFDRTSSSATQIRWVGYVVEAGVFPNGLLTNEVTKTVSAGSISPVDMTVSSGTVISAAVALEHDARVASTTSLSTELFQTGFSSYDMRSHNGLVVADGTTLQVVMPVLQANTIALMTPGQENLLQIWQPDLYEEDIEHRKVSQRAGASLTLAGGATASVTGKDTLPMTVGDSGNLYVGINSNVVVDPGQSIALSSRGSLTVNGRLQAQSGSISLLGPMTASTTTGSLETGDGIADGTATTRAITLGASATLDVSAASYVATDRLGRPYGMLTDGGSIIVGGTVQEPGSRALASDAFVVIEKGALVDASGGSAVFDVNNIGVSSTLASDGGSISIASANGLYLDGTLLAEAGGAGASGGSLTVALEAPNYLSSTVNSTVLALRELLLVQQYEEESAELTYGHAALGVDQVETGGFDSLTLYSNGAVSFGGDLDLTLGRELRIYSGALTVADGVDPAINVSLSAPYLLLAGITDNGASADTYSRPSYQGGVSTLATQASLSAVADLLDVKGVVTIGLNDTENSVQAERAGFGQLNLVSSGDFRFVDAESIMNGSSAAYVTELHSSGDILLRATQIYPATGVGARVLAGRASSTTYDAEGRLVIERYDANAGDPDLPYSVFGSLTVGAATIVQNGVLRAPLGDITLGTDSSVGSTSAVTLGSGSLTSVSAAGLVYAYGGTTDDVTWYYDGEEVRLEGVGYEPTITLSGTDVAVEDGALLDLSGGGELVGAGFIPGRGGSTDARYNALVQVTNDGFTLPSLSTNPVYAIVPSYSSTYAPADSTGAVDPLVGQQITIAAGDIPGLAAGTYTLLPSNYALLPGAFRVEINGTAAVSASSGAIALRNGSYAVSGVLSVANTDIADSLASQFIITSADVLRTYSQYNETSYAEFVAAQAALNGTVRALLEVDAGALSIQLPSSLDSSLTFEGMADFTPGEDGHGGTLTLVTTGTSTGYGAIEILGKDAVPTEGFNGASVYADDLNAIGAARMTIGGMLYSSYGENSSGTNVSNYLQVRTTAGTGSIVLREGAALRAAEVFLVASNLTDGITIETGAGINTIGMGEAAYDSTDGYIYLPGDRAIVAVSNGWLDILAPVAATGSRRAGAGPMAIGVCSATCTGITELYSEGTLAFATLDDFELDDAVHYGTRNLVLTVGTVNAGSNEDLAALAAAGTLTSGLTLNQSVLDRLLQGDTAYGAPALERLVLTAGESFNFFGDVSLDTTDPETGEARLDNLVLTTPAIYGYGDADAAATITTAKLTWAGVDDAELPTPVSGGRGTGSGSLVVNAEVIEFGYDESSRPSGISDDDRTILGFASVAFNASDRITANQQGALAVYQSQTVADDGTLVYQGGDLTLTAPLVTGAGGSVNSITAGGILQVRAPETGAADADSVTLDEDVETGAELNLAASSILIDTTVALPSGKLTATASEGDVTLADGAYLDLSGRAIEMYDVTSYSWGGDVILQSTAGNITQAAGSTIDVSAEYNNAGLITATALVEEAGVVDLQGTLLGSASGYYDAGGTNVPYRAGGVDISAQALGASGTLTEQFAALNTKLNDGGLSGERSFQLKRANDLTIGDELRANEINVSLDNGHLTVVGTIDASGEQVGSIRLAAANGLTLASGAVLDAHGTLLRVDSYGVIIDSPNRAAVELDAGTGTLTLADGVRIDLRYGTDDARYAEQPELQTLAEANGALGTLDLVAARIDANGQAGTEAAATYGDIAIAASDSVDVQGAKSIAVYGHQVYDDAPYGSDEAASGEAYQVITQDYLDGKDAEASRFINAALANSTLLNTKLAGLYNSSYADAFHLRPAVAIVSATADGDMIVSGDLDLSSYRYASLNPNNELTSIYGSGEVGQLTLRAGGDLSIYGSITDGFAPPPETPDDGGWVLTSGVQAFGGDVVVPVAGVTLAEGTTYPAGKTLNYAITASNVTLPSGTTLPTAITLSSALTLPEGTVLAADVLAADGSVLLAAGTMVGSDGLALPVGAQLLAGARLPVVATVATLTWPAGVELPVAMAQAGSLTLPVGALIASGTDVVLPDDALAVDLRPSDDDGNAIKRSNWAVAKMLPAGSQSWSMRLVAGADIEAVDSRRTVIEGGNITLADTSYITDAVIAEATSTDAYWTWGDDPDGKNPAVAVPGGTVTVTIQKTRCESGRYDCVYHEAVNIPEHIESIDTKSPIFSVIRTGTGDLDIAAGGNFSMESPYGVYTSGAQTSLGDEALDVAYNQARALVINGTVLGTNAGDLAAEYEALVSGSDSLYQAWYPDGGGSLWMSVRGNLTGDSWNSSSDDLATANSSVGNWLWRQGTGSTGGVDNIPTSWWINFGTYTYGNALSSRSSYWPMVSGFTGLGTLGGGNATIRVGGDAGVVQPRSIRAASTSSTARSQGVVLAVGSTGRVLSNGSLVLTGGGDLDVRIGGGWNSNADARLSNANGSTAQTHELYGALVNLRGATTMAAGQIGTIELIYGLNITGTIAYQDANEVRAADPYTSSLSLATGGLMLMQGDSTATIASRGDLVLGGTGDPGLVETAYYSDIGGTGVAGQSWFSLWTDVTAVDVLSAGGNLAFDTRPSESVANYQNHVTTNWDYGKNGGWYLLPGNASAVAAKGSIYYGTSSAYQNTSVNTGSLWNTGGLLLAPLGEGTIALLAGDSIYGGGYGISSSGADGSSIATVFRPGFSSYSSQGNILISNTSEDSSQVGGRYYPFFAFGVNSIGSGAGITDEETTASRFYAVDGDIVGLHTGTVVEFGATGPRANQTDYVAAGPIAVRAGGDIVYTGTRTDETLSYVRGFASSSTYTATTSGNLIVHTNANDVSVIEADGNIYYANVNVAGPGTLEISAGGNIIQNDLANITSIGPVVASDSRPGASIVVQAGQTASATNYAGFLSKYLDAGNLAEVGIPLADQPDNVVKTYETELVEWLSERYGYTGSIDEARAYFDGLAPEQQRIFARLVYFAELREGGREYNDADGPRTGSYLRGRHAIAALFPEKNAAGEAIVYQGDLLIYGDAGIHTNLGGDVHVLTPGGSQTYGIEGPSPGGTAGVITRGEGDIHMYSLGSILLGQSRIMTAAGGDILGWSAEGDINAGRGSKTTLVYAPPRRMYDAFGNVEVTPDVPATGAGIATLNRGDVDLIAPLGTIDAGEAGIRVAGNVNVAALHVVNADNIQVQGDAKGIPVVAAVNTGALTSASAAASSAASAAQESVARSRAAARQNLPSIISVQILGFGNESPQPSGASSGARPADEPASYRPNNLVQVVGRGDLSPAQAGRLTQDERKHLDL